MTDYTNPDAGVRTQTAAQLQAEANQAAAIAKELGRQAAAARAAEEAARRPQMPEIGIEPGDHAVVCFAKYMSGREYHFAALGWRVGRSVRWSVTGQLQDRLNWPGLLVFIGEGNWHTLVRMGQTQLLGPTPDQEPPVRERMGSFGRVMGTDVRCDLDVDPNRW